MGLPVNAALKDIALVTPSDTGDLAAADGQLPIGFIITGTVGDVKVTTADGTVIVLPTAMFTAKDRFPLAVRTIHSTSTTSTGIYAIYGVG